MTLLERVIPYTVIDTGRLANLQALAVDLITHGVPGDLVECGVARGGSAALLLASLPGRTGWLYDTFTGLPAPTIEDGPDAPPYAGANQTSFGVIREAMNAVGVTSDRYHLRAGLFQETFYQNPAPNTIAFLHIDADWYHSVGQCLERWYEQVSPGGIIMLDDYGFWQGCRQAYLEFCQRKMIVPDFHRCGDQGWWRKI